MYTSILRVFVLLLLYISTRYQVEAQSQGNGNVTLTFTSSSSLYLITFPTVVVATLPNCAIGCSKINGVGCSYSDTRCNCADANIVNVVVACIKQSCSESNTQYALAYWLMVCGDSGIILPVTISGSPIATDLPSTTAVPSTSSIYSSPSTTTTASFQNTSVPSLGLTTGTKVAIGISVPLELMLLGILILNIFHVRSKWRSQQDRKSLSQRETPVHDIGGIFEAPGA